MKNDANIKSLSYESIIAVVAVLTVLIPLCVFLAISFYSSSYALTEVIKKELEDKSTLVAFDINNFISERITDAKIISQADVLESGNISSIIQYLTEIVEENKWINDIDVLSVAGKIVASSGVQNEKGELLWDAHPIDKTLYLSAVKAKQGQVYVSEAKKLDTGPGILLMTPITDDTNTKLIGLLTLEVNLKNIARILSLFNQGIVGEKYAYIVDNGGRVIVSDDPSVQFLDVFPDLKVQPELLNAFSLQGDIGNIVYTDIAGDEVMAGYADMAEFGVNNALDWSIIAIAPMYEITAPVSNMKRLLLIIGVIIAFLSTFMAYRIVVTFSGSLKKIASQADAISQGEYSEKLLDQTKRKGAINTLVIAFNRMEENIKQLISELKDREQRLDITLNSIGDGVIATDEEGNITRMNPAAVKLTGWLFKEAEGQLVENVFVIVDETTRKVIENPVEKVIATGKTIYLSNHTTLISKGGKEYHIEDSAAPIRDEDNNILGMILIFSDVTQRKLAEKQYRRALKMDALGKLTGGVAHDYNNMLGVIMGYSEVLKDELKDQPKLLKHISTILKSAERGASLTKKLLDFSRYKPSEVVVLNFNTLLHDQQIMLEKTLTVRIDLVLELAQDLWFVCLDEGDTIDAILNVCINAMHAIEGNGYLTIHTSNEKIEQMEADALGISKGDYVLLSITDTGCGMDESTKDKIFDPFFTTKGEKGTGLGLSQVYGFVQRSNGAIKVNSELERGTKQALYFPRYIGVEQLEKTVENDTSTKITGTETILVVDDEIDLLKYCRTALKQHGFTVFSAENANTALNILKNEKVDLLFSDIIMPEMDGYQLAAIVREKYPKIKIQLTSGFSGELNADTANEKIQQGSLLKPYNSKTLLQAIRSALDKK